MGRNCILTSLAAGLFAATLLVIGCTVPNLLGTPDPLPMGPDGATVLFRDSFGGSLSHWDASYMVSIGVFYPRMRNSVAEVHSGTHSVTSDSSWSALVSSLASDNIINTNIAGLEFWLYAKTLGEANFAAQIGQNAGPSGGLGKSYGIGFGRNDSIKCTYFDFTDSIPYRNKSIAPIQLDHWYRCDVEVDFNAKAISYYIDSVKVQTVPLQLDEMYGIDRILISRGEDPTDSLDHPSGPKQYFIDDVVLYKK
jgi:hypothetical protein